MSTRASQATRIRWLVALLVLCALAAGAWGDTTLTREKRTPRVVLRAPETLSSKLTHLADVAEERLIGIEDDLLGLPRVDVVEVRLVVRAEDLPSVAPAGYGAPRWAVGVAYPEAGVVSVAARGASGDLVNMDETLAHELAHMALERALGEARVPRWLNEGFANQHSAESSMSRTALLAGALVGDKLIPIARLDAAFPAREDQVSLA
jgi:hypothetical protein